MREADDSFDEPTVVPTGEDERPSRVCLHERHIRLSPRTPETFQPSEEGLLKLVAWKPGISLREVCQELWPSLRWRPLDERGDSLAEKPRLWLDRLSPLTAAAWVRDCLQDLVIDGRLRFGPRRQDEVDREAQVSYVLPTERRRP